MHITFGFFLVLLMETQIAGIPKGNESCSVKGSAASPVTIRIEDVTNILQSLLWKSWTIVYDRTTAKLISNITSGGKDCHMSGSYKLLAVTSLTDTQIRYRLTEFYLSQSAPHNYMVICSDTCTTTVIHVANTLDEFSARYTYMRHSSRWMVIGSRTTKNQLAYVGNYLDNLAVLVIPTCAVLTQKLKGDFPLDVSTLMWTTSGRKWSRISLSSVVPNTRHIFPNIANIYNRRQFIITTKTWLGFTRKTIVAGRIVYDGYCIDVLNELAFRLNFTYKITEPVDDEWGAEVNGVWTGITGQLIRREVDFAIGSLSRNSARDKVVDFVKTPFFRDYKDIMYRKLGATKKWNLLIEIFKPTVLLCICLALSSCICLHLLLKLGPYERGHRPFRTTGSMDALYIYGALFRQGSTHLPMSLSGRILVASWCVFSIIISAYYSAKLIADLAVPKTEVPFSNLQQLLQSEYTWGVVGRGSTYYLLSASTDPDIKRLWEKMCIFNQTDTSVFSGSNSAHIQKVMSDKYAYIMGHEKLGDQIACQITYLREKLFEYTKGMALPQQSPLKDNIDMVMLDLSENGFLNHLTKKWLLPTPQCLDTRTSAIVVSLQDIQAVFYLLAVGMGVASLALLIERVHRQYYSRR